MIFAGFPGIFCEVPVATPGAAVGMQIFWRVGCGDLMRGGGQGFAFGGVPALAGDRAFGVVVHG